jgi:hypothetical protein
MFQCALIDDRIVREFIAGGAVAAVAVGQDDEFGVGIDRDQQFSKSGEYEVRL